MKENKFIPDKSKMKDKMGRLITQGLFLEIQYERNFAMYSLDEEDKEYEGRIYPSLKRLYLEEEDLTEYSFVKKYLFSWEHWERMNSNAILSKHFERWREELRLSMRSEALRNILDQALSGDNFQAAKFIAEGSWDKRRAGRPTKAEMEKEARLHDRLVSDFSEDFDRLRGLKLVK